MLLGEHPISDDKMFDDIKNKPIPKNDDVIFKDQDENLLVLR